MYRKPETRTLTVANGATTSGAFGVADYVVAGFIFPAALTSTTATLTASETETGTYSPVYDSDGNQVSLTVAASRAVGLSGSEADAVAPWKWLKLVMGSSEGGARTITVALKG